MEDSPVEEPIHDTNALPVVQDVMEAIIEQAHNALTFVHQQVKETTPVSSVIGEQAFSIEEPANDTPEKASEEGQDQWAFMGKSQSFDFNEDNSDRRSTKLYAKYDKQGKPMPRYQKTSGI